MNDKIELRIAIKAYYDFQDMETRMGNRLKVKKNGDDQKLPDDLEYVLNERGRDLFSELRESSIQHQNTIMKYIKKELKSYPIYTEWLQKVKGVGETMAAVIITEYDINRADTVSKLWAFTGLAPGKDRLKKGEKASFNSFLRAKMCGVLGSGFLKCKSEYSEYYYNYKARLEQEEGWKEEKPGHRHKAATRYMIKMFLKDLYVAWRTIEGLPVREPYQVEYLNHRHNVA